MNVEVAELEARADDAAALMRALANPHRLMILCELSRGERSVGALERALGMKQSPLSQHLARLRRDGLVTTRRESQTIHYSMAEPRVLRVIAALRDIYCSPAPPK